MKKAKIICLIFAVIAVLVVGVVGIQVFSARNADFETSLRVENKNEGIYLDWSSHSGADGYYIYRWSDDVKETIATIEKFNKSAFTDKNVESGKVYKYSVCAYNNEAEPTETTTINIMRIETPKILSVQNSAGGIDVNWKQIVGAKKYTIYREYDGEATVVGEVTSEKPCSFTDSTVVSGCKYKYSVVASADIYKSYGEYKKSSTYVPVPEDVMAINNNGYVSVSWSKVSEADNYILYRKTNGSKWNYLGLFDSAITRYTDMDVSNGNVYSYTVKVLSDDNYSGYDSFGVSTNYVDVTSIKTIANVNDCVKLTWNKVDKAVQYRVYKRAEGENDWTFVGESRSTSFADANVGDGVQYTYCVKAVGDKGGFSAYSDWQYITTLKMPEIKLYCNSKALTVTWNKMPMATSYRVYKKTADAKDWTFIATVKDGKTSYTDKQVKEGVTYTYTVRQVYSGLYGSYNKGVVTKFNAAPKVLLKLSPNGLKLDWNKANGGTGYYVDRKTENNTTWTTIATISDLGKITYTDAKASYGYINYYRVRVIGTNRMSDTVKIYGVDPKKPAIALTYDDGPHPTVTHDILDVLEKYDSRATFFVVGSRVSWNEDSIKRATKLNCEIGNHTHNHTILTSADNSKIASEIAKTNNIVKNISGKAPEIMRAPGGSFNSRVKNNVGMPLIQWSVDTLDWKSRNANSVIASVKNNAKDGSIILMHDLYGSTAEATKTIVPWLVNEGYQLVTVTELMQLKGIDMKDGSVYYSAS